MRVPHSSRFSKGALTAADYRLFQNLHDDRGIVPLWLADEQVNMFRHYYESHDAEAIAFPNLLEHIEKDVARALGSQKGPTAVAAGRDEMKVTSTIKAPQRIAFGSEHGAAL